MNGTKVFIDEIAVETIIGVSDEERSKTQTILVSVELEFDTKKAEETDDISETVNYEHIYRGIIEHTENSRYYLLEKLAHQLVGVCLKDKRIKKTKVIVKKTGRLPKAKSVSVTMEGKNE